MKKKLNFFNHCPSILRLQLLLGIFISRNSNRNNSNAGLVKHSREEILELRVRMNKGQSTQTYIPSYT